MGVIGTLRAAARFTVSSGDVQLTSITLPIGFFDIDTMSLIGLRVRLTEDSGGFPGTTLEVLSEDEVWPVASLPFDTTTTLTSVTNPVLLDGQSYWIVTEPTYIPAENTGYVYLWWHNTTGATVPFLQEQEFGALPSDPWSNPADPNNVAFRVLPEPSNALLQVAGVVAIALLHRWRQ